MTTGVHAVKVSQPMTDHPPFAFALFVPSGPAEGNANRGEDELERLGYVILAPS